MPRDYAHHGGVLPEYQTTAHRFRLAAVGRHCRTGPRGADPDVPCRLFRADFLFFARSTRREPA